MNIRANNAWWPGGGSIPSIVLELVNQLWSVVYMVHLCLVAQGGFDSLRYFRSFAETTIKRNSVRKLSSCNYTCNWEFILLGIIM